MRSIGFLAVGVICAVTIAIDISRYRKSLVRLLRNHIGVGYLVGSLRSALFQPMKLETLPSRLRIGKHRCRG
jgi:ABC-type lipoprotein release transport system permease subunit